MAGKGPSRQQAHQLEMKKVELELAKLGPSYEVRHTLIKGLMTALGIAALALPLLVLKEIVEPFAGQDTNVNVNIAVSISLVGSLALNGFQYAKGRTRKQELQRERDRADKLELKLGVPAPTKSNPS